MYIPIVFLVLYLLVIALAPEVGLGHIHGPVVLNVSGNGYSKGNVVWLSLTKKGCKPTDIVLYDWRKTINAP